jgi:hypothetical protein
MFSLICIFFFFFFFFSLLRYEIKWNEMKRRDTTVSIASGYGLDDRRVGVRVPVGLRIFFSPCLPDRLWGPPNLLSNGYRWLFPGGKAIGTWSWPLTSNQCLAKENLALYIHLPLRLYGVVLNWLNTGTAFLHFSEMKHTNGKLL